MTGRLRLLLIATVLLIVLVGFASARDYPFRLGASAPDAPSRLGNEFPVTAMHQGLGPANNSPMLVADPTDPRFVVLANRLDAPDFNCALQVSGDGGRHWVSADPVPNLPAGADKCYAPEVAFTSEGVLHYLFVGLKGTGNEPMGAFLTTSADRGRTFSPPHQVLGPANFGVRMAIDPTLGEHGRLHLLWLHATVDPPTGGFGPPPNPILTAHSDDGGGSFSTPVQVAGANRERVVAPSLALGPNHSVYVGYYDLGEDRVDYQGLDGPTWGGTWSLLVATSTDGGAHFDSGVVVDDALVPHERVMLIFTMPPPALAADAAGVCSAWSDARNGDADVFVRCSNDSGRTWAPPIRVNDDPIKNDRQQYLPRLAFSPSGRLDVIFYDRRNNRQDVGNEVYFASSSDGGMSFHSNIRVTSHPSDSRIGQQYANVSAVGQTEFGSRLALLSTDSRSLGAWTDTRNSRPYTTGQDLFVREIETVGGDLAWGLLLGVCLVLAGPVVVACTLKWRNRRSRRGYHGSEAPLRGTQPLHRSPADGSES